MRRIAFAWVVALGLLRAAPAQAQQDLGHRVLGTIGLDAGSQPKSGLYVADRLVFYRADELRDRRGDSIPVGLDLDAFANAVGVLAVFELGGTFVSASFGLPVASTHVQTTRPEASVDRFGLGDLYLQPLRLGWRWPRVEMVTGYSVYAPTSLLTSGAATGLGRSQWVHEFTLGGTAFFDDARTWRLSALASYDLYRPKSGLDVTRGDTVQVQGGVGASLFRSVDVGLAGYALWQVRDDRGSALPPVLAGARDRAFALGPEVDVLVPALRCRFTARWEHDLTARSRPLGWIFVLGATYVAWRPDGG